MRHLVAFLLFLLLLVPLGNYTTDVSSDGTHTIKLVNETMIYVDDQLVVNASSYYYSVDGDGTKIYALGDERIDVYDYSGNLIDNITLSEYYYSIAMYGSSYALAGMNYTEGSHVSFIVIDGNYVREGSGFVIDMDDVNNFLGFLVSYEENVVSFYVYDGKEVKLEGNYSDARYILGMNGEFLIYDEGMHEIARMKVEREGSSRIEPKPVREMPAEQAAVAATGGSAGLLGLIYYIRERHLTSVTNVRRLFKGRANKYLIIPALGLIIELAFAPKDPLTRLVVFFISIGAGYSVYSMVTRNVKRKFMRIFVIYGFVASFLGLIALTRRPSVVAFYALSGVYAYFIHNEGSYGGGSGNRVRAPRGSFL